jgi:hypothetical protein
VKRRVVPSCFFFGIGLVACTAGEASPTGGTVTIQFPSTQAAVATDYVQLYVFDVTPEDRGSICLDKVTARKREEPLNPSFTPPAWNICELLGGRNPATIPYGEKAILAVAQRKDKNNELQDFMIGCAVETVGDGDAPIPIHLALLDVRTPVPDTNCATVGDYCGLRCQ